MKEAKYTKRNGHNINIKIETVTKYTKRNGHIENKRGGRVNYT